MEPSDETPPPRRAAKIPITTDDIMRVDAALTKSGGHRAHAAALLGLSEERVKSVIKSSAALTAKWKQREGELPPTGLVGEIDRKEPLPTLKEEHRKIAEAITNQDALVAGDWGKLGFSDVQQEFLRTLQSTYTTNLRGTLNLTYGGMVHAYTRLLFVFEDLIKRIEEIDEDPDKYTREQTTQFGVNIVKEPHEFRCELYDRLIAVSGELRKVNSDATKANWVRAQIDRLKTDEGKDGKRKKAGWSARKVVEVEAAPKDEAPE